jgi:WD40 repeat protein
MLKSLPHMSKPQQYCCCAIGSRDRSLSVWLTALKRPLVIIKELFNDSVLDLTWSFDGLVMMACSWDGTIACVQFEETEIGKALSINEKVYETNYFFRVLFPWFYRKHFTNGCTENAFKCPTRSPLIRLWKLPSCWRCVKLRKKTKRPFHQRSHLSTNSRITCQRLPSEVRANKSRLAPRMESGG